MAVRKKAEKVESYSKYVREMYWPKVSVKKQMELENLKESLKGYAVRHSAHELKTVDGAGADGASGGDRPWRAGIASGGAGSKLKGQRKDSGAGGPQSVGHTQGNDPDGLLHDGSSYNKDPGLNSDLNSNGGPRSRLPHRGSKSSKIRIKGKAGQAG